jgi:2'-5' RNA ligase
LVTHPSYHLWLKPAGATYDVLDRTIRRLAAVLDAPVFAPHVTLLARLTGTEREHIRRTEELARRLQPVEIVLTEPAWGERYFQCVFILVEETGAVRQANALAQQVFERGADPYMPHLSLVYGSYSEARKREVVARLPAELRTAFVASAVYLIRADSDDPADWHEILRQPLNG